MSRGATTRKARHAASGSLAVRTGAPAAAVAAVSSLTLTGVAVLGFMPGGAAFSGLHAGSDGLRGPGVVQAIPFAPPSSSTTSRQPSSGFTVGSPSGGAVHRPENNNGSSPAGPPRAGSGATSQPTGTSTSGPVRTPGLPRPIIVAVGDLSDTLANSAREMVVQAVNTSLSAVMPPNQLLSVQASLGPAVDLAVRTAVSSAAQDALNAATAATAANATPAEVSAVTTQTFRSSLPPALAATVPAAVSTTLTTAGVVTPEAAPVVDALVTVAASTASGDVADVTTQSVVDQVTTVVTTPGATPTTPVLTPSPTTSTETTAPTDTSTTSPSTEPTTSPSTTTSTDEPTGTPETPDADADPTDQSSPSDPVSAAPTATTTSTLSPTATSSTAPTAALTTAPTTVPFALPAVAQVPGVVASVTASHVLVVQLARQTPINPTAVLATSNLFRVAPHLAVRVTTTASASPTSKPRTTTTIVPTTSITSARVTVTAPAAQHDKARPKHSTQPSKQSRPTTKATKRASTPQRTSIPAPSRTGDRPASAPTTSVTPPSSLPDGFSGWSAREQWRWLKQSGQHISYGQWKQAVRQQDSSVTAGQPLGSSTPQAARPGTGKHRR